jgi:hypothetical protein
VWVCSLRYPACNAHASYCHLCPAPLYNIFSHYLINGTIFEKKKLLNVKRPFWFPLQLYLISHPNTDWARYDYSSISFLTQIRIERDMTTALSHFSPKYGLSEIWLQLYLISRLNTDWARYDYSSISFLIQIRIERNMIINVYWSSCNVPLSLVRLLIQFDFSRKIFQKYTNTKFHENPFSGSRDVSSGRSDTTKLIVAFWNFANAPPQKRLARRENSRMN